MTKEELELKHLGAGLSLASPLENTKISIQYAISVLGEIKDRIGSISPTSWQVVKDKIEELKALIK